MADIGNPTVYIGNSDWFRGDAESVIPSTHLDPDTLQSVVGGFFRLDGSASSTEDPLDVLYFKWSAVEAPSVSALSVGPLFPQEAAYWDRSQLRVEVDAVGLYKVELTVWAANGGMGGTDSTFILSLPSESPLFSNTSLDTAWVWNTLPNFWSTLPTEDRTRIELIWRGVLQSLGGELMLAYNIDDNKSITTIQERVYDRWVSIPLDVDISSSAVKVHRNRSATINRVDGDNSAIVEDMLGWRDLTEPRIYSLEASLISATEILPLVSELSDFVPSKEDEGRSIEIDVGALTLSSVITYVDERWAGRSGSYRYVLSEPIMDLSRSDLSLDLGSIHTIRIYREPGDVLPIPVLVDGEPNFLVSYTQVTRRALFSRALPLGASDIRTYPAALVKDAERVGISRGDLLYFELTVPSTSESVAFRVDVVGVIKALQEDDVYYVLFDTRASSYSDIGVQFLTLFNQPTEIIREWRQAVSSNTFLDSIEGRTLRLGVNNALAIPGLGKMVTYLAEPSKITRLARVQIDSDIVSVVKMSEFVEDHEYTVGQLITEGSRSVNVSRPPLHMLENRDFVVTHVTSEDGEDLTYVDFISDHHRSTPPRKLWAETVIRDNHVALERIFGTLLSFSYDEWKERGLSMSYKAVLAAMLYARVAGSSIGNLQMMVSVLCGVPFVPTRSRVISIDRELDPLLVSSDTVSTRVTVEEIDSEGRLLGSIKAYKIKGAAGDAHTETSGLYYGSGQSGRIAVGDILEPFTPIGLGVLIEDIVTDYRGVFKPVADRHLFRARVNTDSTELRSKGDVELLYDFIRDIKPTYVDFLLSIFKYNVDRIKIESRAIVKYRSRFFDNPYLLRGPADIYDDEIPGRALNDLSSYTVLSTWFPRDGKVSVNSDGTLTLISEASYFTVESLADGFVRYPGHFTSPLIPHRYTSEWINTDTQGEPSLAWIRGTQDIEESDRTSEYTLPDYVVFRSGIAEGMYRIHRVVSSTELTLVPIGPNGADLARFEGEGIVFVVGRLSTEIIFDGIVAEGGDVGVHLVGEGVIHDGIAAGDELSFPGTTRGRYTVREVRYTRTDRGEPAVFVSPYGPQLLQAELNPLDDSPIRAIIRRPQLAATNRGTYQIERAESKYGTYAYRVQGAASPASVGLSVGDAVLSVDDQGIDSYIVGIFGSLLWLAYAPDTVGSEVKMTRDTGISSGSLDDVDTTLGTSCLIVARPSLLGRQSWATRHPSTLTARVSLSDDLLSVLTLTEPLTEGTLHPIAQAAQAGDMLKIVGPMYDAPSASDLSSHPFVDGFGLVRIVEVVGNRVQIAQPLPLSSAYAGAAFSVKLVRETNLSSTYWRIS